MSVSWEGVSAEPLPCAGWVLGGEEFFNETTARVDWLQRARRDAAEEARVTKKTTRWQG